MLPETFFAAEVPALAAAARRTEALAVAPLVAELLAEDEEMDGFLSPNTVRKTLPRL